VVKEWTCVSEPVVRGPDAELEKLAGEIAWYEEEARKTVKLALQYKLEIGRRLARAKAILPHGRFLSWAQHEFGWTPRHVQRHLMLADNARLLSYLPPAASLRMALAAIRELHIETGGKPTEARQDQSSSQRIHLIGEINQGRIDQDQLLVGVKKLAEALGGQNVRWRIRSS
jgi:hypothetical protein